MSLEILKEYYQEVAKNSLEVLYDKDAEQIGFFSYFINMTAFGNELHVTDLFISKNDRTIRNFSQMCYRCRLIAEQLNCKFIIGSVRKKSFIFNKHSNLLKKLGFEVFFENDEECRFRREL